MFDLSRDGARALVRGPVLATRFVFGLVVLCPINLNNSCFPTYLRRRYCGPVLVTLALNCTRVVSERGSIIGHHYLLHTYILILCIYI